MDNNFDQACDSFNEMLQDVKWEDRKDGDTVKVERRLLEKDHNYYMTFTVKRVDSNISCKKHVEKELIDLYTKIEELEVFLDNGTNILALLGNEYELLLMQLDAMKTYHRILGFRYGRMKEGLKML